MYKHYVKLTIQFIKETPYLCGISILGTALAISLIMLVVVNFHSKIMNIAPEVNRNRTLYVKWVGVKDKGTDRFRETGYLSLKTIRACFQSLKTPEAVSIIAPIQSQFASIPAGNKRRCFVMATDDIFWKIYRFNCLEGNFYTKADFDSGIDKVVISRQLARILFNTTRDVVGKTIQLNYIPYTVCAVVDDVTTQGTYSYANAWIPYTTSVTTKAVGIEGITGKFKCIILARSSRDFDNIRQEIDKQVQQYNVSLSDHTIELFRQPDTALIEGWRFGPGYPGQYEQLLNTFVMIIIALMVPAINLSGLTFSRMQSRIGELGVRKAFGGTRMSLLRQILFENMIFSLLGGLLGFFTTYVLSYIFKNWAYTSATYYGLEVTSDLPLSVFINVPMFLCVFLFCTLLNLLSAGIPAWRVSSMPISESLKEN